MRVGNLLSPQVLHEFGPFRLNLAERLIEKDGCSIPLTPKALDVLIVLLENRGRLVEKDVLIRKVWPDTFVEDNSLAFNISALRKVLGESPAEPRYIETVAKRGYRFIAEVTEVTEVPTAIDAKPPPRGWLGVLQKRLRLRIIAIAAVLLLSTAAVWVAVHRRQRTIPNAGRIVAAEFINKTGDPVFDGALDQGLSVQLLQSPDLTLVPEGAIRRTLRLMHQPPKARLTLELAREVCERTGSVAVLEGSITKLGTQYALGLRAANCGSGDIVDDEQARVERKEDVLDALGRMITRFRARIGESPATLQKHDTPLAEASTASLEALKAYSAGLKVHFTSGAKAALPFFERAVEIDPGFAMAHSYLGRVYANLDQSELAAESIRRAWQLRDRTSDRERFGISVRYESLVTGNLERLRELSEEWIRTYPRDPQPHIGLSIYYRAIGQYEKASEASRKSVEVEPDFVPGYASLAMVQVYLNRPMDSDDTVQQAARHGLQSDELLMTQYDAAFLRGDRARMQWVAAQARERPGAENWISNREASALASAGHLQQARTAYRRAVEQAQNAAQHERAALWEAGAAVREAFFGNPREAKQNALAAHALSKDREIEYGAAFALALSGQSFEAQPIADDLEKRYPDATSVRYDYMPAVRAQLALNRGDAVKALALLEKVGPYELGAHESTIHALFGAFYPIYVRGEAYLAVHRGAQAAMEFQKILDRSAIVLSDPVGVVARLQLARALALSGSRAKAGYAYDDFLTLWKDADPGIPVLNQAKRERAKLALDQ